MEDLEGRFSSKAMEDFKLIDMAVGGDEREDSEDFALHADGRPSAVAARRGRVGLDHGLVGDVLLEPRNRAIRHRRFDLVRRVQQLVAEHDAGETEDVELVAELRVRRVAQHERWHVGGLELQEREISARHGRGGGRVVLGHRRRQPNAIREEHVQRRLELDLGPRDDRGQRLTPKVVTARLTRSPLGLLVGDPLVRLLHGGDHVGIRDHPTARTDEPAGTGFAKRSGRDALSDTGRTRQHDLGRDFRHDERDGWLGAKQGFLDGDLRAVGDAREREENGKRSALAHDSNSKPQETTKRRLQGEVPGALSVFVETGSYFRIDIASTAFALAVSMFPALQAASASRTSFAASPLDALAPATARGAWVS